MKIISLTMIAFLLCACEENNSSASQPMPVADEAVSLELSVTDFSGNTINLAGPARRIVALAPHIVENLFAIGAGEQIVGVVDHSDFPSAAKELPIVGGYEQTNFERIVELKPDIVIAWQTGNSASDVIKLRELGIKVFIDQPNSLDDIATSLRLLGAITGRESQSTQIAEEFVSYINTTRANNAGKRQINVFYQVWNDPLISINGNHIISDAIRTCGGRNVFADEVAIAPRINIESIIDASPEAIIASGMDEARPEWLDEWRKWTAIPAVQRDNLFYVNPDHLQRHTTRQRFAIESICEQLDMARASK